MEGFINFILILILIWLGFSLFFRYVFPRLLLYWVKRKQKKMMEQMGIKPDDFKASPDEAFGSAFNDDEDDVPF